MASNQESRIYISPIRRFTPQILACFAKNISLMNFGIAFNFSTIIIPALTGLNPINNPNEHLFITPEESSWIASVVALCFVVGSSMSNFLDPLGRKKSIILCNIPFLIGWIWLSQSNSFISICMSMVLLGSSAGFLESPIYSYIGEIAEPKIRTVLSSTTSLTFQLSGVFIFSLSIYMPWRDISLICGAVPVFAAFTMLMVPETPQWLLSQNRTSDALKALQWFRGWTDPQDVQIEFENLQRYRTVAYACYSCEKKSVHCDHPSPNLLERLRDFCRRKTIIPFFIIICSYLNAVFVFGVYRPFLVPTLKSFRSPIDPNVVLVWDGYVGFVANILCIVSMRLFGKRIVYLISLALAILTAYALGVYGFFYLNQNQIPLYLSYFPIFGFLFLSFLSNFGLRTLVNLLMSEIFSYRTKSLGAGLSFSVGAILSTIMAKTFYLLQEVITLPGQCVLYASLATLGFILIYLFLPETEGRTLEEIENYFSNKERNFFDIHIEKLSSEKKSTTHGADYKLIGECQTELQEP